MIFLYFAILCIGISNGLRKMKEARIETGGVYPSSNMIDFLINNDK
jgi:hypothetical protein